MKSAKKFMIFPVIILVIIVLILIYNYFSKPVVQAPTTPETSKEDEFLINQFRGPIESPRVEGPSGPPPQ